MLKLIKTLFKDNALYVAIAVTIGIGYLSLVKVSVSTIDVNNFDKVYHIIAYFVLGLFWLLSFPVSIKENKVKVIIALCCIIYGIVIEVLQVTFTTYRTASILDMLANTVGVIVALLIFNTIFKKIDAI